MGRIKPTDGTALKKIRELCFSESKLKAHLKLTLKKHKPRRYIYKNGASRAAAVLIPIYFKNGQAHLLFTKRTDLVEHHKGQISFPGGGHDADDKDMLETALRETEEEVGIQREDIQIAGQTDLFLTNTNFLVTPFIGFFEYPYPFNINQQEIDYIIETPLVELLKDEIFEIKPFVKKNQSWMVHYYHYNNELIWGVTGFLLSNFLSIVFKLDRNIITEPVTYNGEKNKNRF